MTETQAFCTLAGVAVRASAMEEHFFHVVLVHVCPCGGVIDLQSQSPEIG